MFLLTVMVCLHIGPITQCEVVELMLPAKEDCRPSFEGVRAWAAPNGGKAGLNHCMPLWSL